MMIRGGFKDFSPLFRVVMWASGIAVAGFSYRLLPGMWVFSGVVMGMTILVIGVYSEMASLLKMKSFDNRYKKVHESYKTRVDKQERQE